MPDLPDLTHTRLAGAPDSPRLLLVGPSLGTSVEELWRRTALLLEDHYAEVVGWDLPGHGRTAAAAGPFTVADLAAAVRRSAESLAAGREVSYAGVSLGGAVGLELALDPGVVGHVTTIAAAAPLGEPTAWHERAALVRTSGTPVMVAASSQRWFATGFPDRDPATVSRLLLSLSDADDESYALACEALAALDVHGRLASVQVPMLVAAGELDVVVPPGVAQQTAAAADAEFEVLAGCGHLPPAEDPVAVARMLMSVTEERVHG
jgi:pimeloyl-ACP methyl ester carboxylesterase